jgi:hypothetical protein
MECCGFLTKWDARTTCGMASGVKILAEQRSEKPTKMGDLDQLKSGFTIWL